MNQGFENREEQRPSQQDGADSSFEESNTDAGAPPSYPEPPVRWNPEDANTASSQNPERPVDTSSSQQDGMGGIGKTRFQLKSEEASDFISARRFLFAAQIIAIVSIFFGGMLLSTVALICALVGNGKLNRIAANRPEQPDVQQALKRSGRMIIAVAAIALVLNFLTVAFLYPWLVQTGQLGDLGSLMGSPGSSGTSTGNSTWG